VVEGSVIFRLSPVSELRTENAFEGIIFKVWEGDYKWDNIKEYLTAGKLPIFYVNEDVLSQFLANRLKLKVGDEHLFLKEGQSKLPNIRRFKIVGILI
jgi:lipoprotein-releasing system permease protein